MYKFYEIELNEKTLIKQNNSLKLLLFSIMVDLKRYIKSDLKHCLYKEEIQNNKQNSVKIKELMLDLIFKRKKQELIKSELISVIKYYNYRDIEIGLED